MRRSLVWACVGIAGALASGCDCSGNLHAEEGPCDVAPEVRPEACGQPCSSLEPCPGGFYCHATGVCTADCEPESGAGCPAPATCTASGMCLSPDGGVAMDARPRADVPGCANVSVATRRVTPTVVLVVDQ